MGTVLNMNIMNRVLVTFFERKLVCIVATVFSFVLLTACESSVDSTPSPMNDAASRASDARASGPSVDSISRGGIDGVTASFSIDGPEFFDMPFPIDLRRGSDGRLNLNGFPNPENNKLVETYTKAVVSDLDGFSIVPTVYFRFDGAIDAENVTPTILTGEEGANVILVNVDQSSFQYSVRVPVTTRFWGRTDGVYIPQNTLMIQPVFGLPLRENTTYACLVLRELGAADGEPLGQPSIVAQGLDGEGPLAQLYQPLNAWLKGFGSYLSKDQIAVATVFTTGAPAGELSRIAEHVRTKSAISPITDVVPLDEPSGYYVAYEGRYLTPNFQSGEKPYEVEGGAILFDGDGAPILNEVEDIRFAVTVPKSAEMPAAGWPLVLYGHGTGGDYRSFIRASGNAPARILAQRGFAVLSIDQPLHGERGTGSDSVFLSFNFSNPDSARSNFRQSAIDVLVQLKMAQQGISFDVDGTTVTFDPENVYYYGHSHGAVVGALFTPFAPGFRGTVLSAAGGGLSHTLMLRKDLGGEALDFAQLVEVLLGTVDGELDVDHPVMSLLQMLVDTTDPIAYAGLFNPTGGSAKPPSVLMTEGLEDAATPPITTEYLAAAARIPLLQPVAQQSLTHDILGLSSVAKPVAGNYSSKGGSATSVLAQFAEADHFAVFDSAKAADMVGDFLQTAVEQGAPAIE
jgi:hypothetical protein